VSGKQFQSVVQILQTLEKTADRVSARKPK
jgi:hypothetical protein